MATALLHGPTSCFGFFERRLDFLVRMCGSWHLDYRAMLTFVNTGVDIWQLWGVASKFDRRPAPGPRRSRLPAPRFPHGASTRSRSPRFRTIWCVRACPTGWDGSSRTHWKRCGTCKVLTTRSRLGHSGLGAPRWCWVPSSAIFGPLIRNGVTATCPTPLTRASGPRRHCTACGTKPRRSHAAGPSPVRSGSRTSSGH